MSNVNQCLVPIISLAYDMFFNSDTDEEETELTDNLVKYFVESIEAMNSQQFKRHFRMDSETCEMLLQKIYAVYEFSQHGHPELPLRISLLICLWYLSNIESFRGVAARFQVSKSTAWAAVLRICKSLVLCQQQFHIIKWPSPQAAEIISNSFHAKYNIPGIIGIIDGSHIKIVAPSKHPNSYINRKGYHSVILQGVCDNRKLFTDVHIGEAGSVHDYTVFLKSDVSKRPDQDYPNNTHIIGDLAYKLSKWCLVGFKDNGHLTRSQKHFNIALSKARVKIEHTFALLKGRFRRLKLIESIVPENVCLLILSCCILHNICILKGDEPELLLDMDEELLLERVNNPRNIADYEDVNDNRQAILKRNEIVNALYLRFLRN